MFVHNGRFMDNDTTQSDAWLREAFQELRIPQTEAVVIESFLAPLKHKSPITRAHYEHSVRVGILAKRIASFMHLDAKALFYAGIFHDLGKCAVRLESLGKTEQWTDADMAELRKHVKRGYEIIRGRFDFSAEVILWHHRFQSHGYPRVLPKPLHGYSLGTKVLIAEYGRILAIADVYDALHRTNSKFGEKRTLSPEEIMHKMHEYNPDRKQLIDDLYAAEILDRYGETPSLAAELTRHDTQHHRPRNPEETARHIMLATALEPVSDKESCTTRYTNVSRHLKLEYFIAAGINLGDAFREMAWHMMIYRRSPGIRKLYSAAHQAQKDSALNRAGGRINHGIIELLTPIVASQYRHDLERTMDTDEMLRMATELLKLTSREDVNYLCGLKRLAYDMCHYHDRAVPQHPATSNVHQYYTAELETANNPTSRAHNTEFLNGFRTVLNVYSSIMTSTRHGLNNKTEEAYGKILLLHDPDIGRGFLADCIAVGLYLCLSQNPDITLIT